MGRTPDVPTGAFLGTVGDGAASPGLKPGDLVAGVGPLADRVSVARDRLRLLDADARSPREGLALLPVVASLVDALGSARLALGDRVCVSGQGLAARLSMQLAELSTGSPPSALSRNGGVNGTQDAGAPHDTVGVDLLVDTTADSAWWSKALPLVREQGRVLLLLPPGPQVYPFDFYPMIHRRSLSLLARRVPGISGRPTIAQDDIRVLQHLFDRGLLAADGLLTSVRAESLGAMGSLFDLNAVGTNQGLVWWFDGA
jgi:NADPH:quinone reductase-like Zn-dependent oxidoreductase